MYFGLSWISFDKIRSKKLNEITTIPLSFSVLAAARFLF